MVLFSSICKTIVFMSFLFLCYVAAWCYSSYDPSKPDRKYITIKNKSFQKIFISQSNDRYAKVRDQSKLSFASFVAYVLQSLLALTYILLHIMPDIPCEPVVFSYTRGGNFIIDTVNERICFFSVSILLCSEILYLLLPTTLSNLRNGNIALSTRIILLFTCFGFLSLTIWFITVLI